MATEDTKPENAPDSDADAGADAGSDAEQGDPEDIPFYAAGDDDVAPGSDDASSDAAAEDDDKADDAAAAETKAEGDTADAAEDDKSEGEPPPSSLDAKLADLQKRRADFNAKAEPERRIRELEQTVKDLQGKLDSKPAGADLSELAKSDPIKAAEQLTGLSIHDLVERATDAAENGGTSNEDQPPPWARQMLSKVEALEAENAALKKATTEAAEAAKRKATAAEAEAMQANTVRIAEQYLTAEGERYAAALQLQGAKSVFDGFRSYCNQHKISFTNDADGEAEAKELFLAYADEVEVRERAKVEKLTGKKFGAQGSQEDAGAKRANAKNGKPVAARAAKGAPATTAEDEIENVTDPIERARYFGSNISFFEKDA